MTMAHQVGDRTPDHTTTAHEVMDELRRMVDMCVPLTAVNLLVYLKGLVAVVSLGRLGSLELAGGALAVGFTNVTGYSVLSGLATGMEPIASQAFGSRNGRLAAGTLFRTVLMLLLISLPIGILWTFVQPIMVRTGQDPEIARVAAQYCRFAIPDLAATSLLLPARAYLRSKGKPGLLVPGMVLAAVLHLPLTTFLGSTRGVSGVAMATCVTNFNTLVFLMAFLACHWDHDLKLPPPSSSHPGELSSDLLRYCSWGDLCDWPEWASLFRLALPSCLGVCLEWWWYELMTMAAGYLREPHTSLAAAAIVIQTTGLMYTVPTTLSSAVSARVGNELGAGQCRRARLSATVAMALSILASSMGLVWTTIGKDAWARVFTGDKSVLALTRIALPIIGLCELANCPQTTGCGMLRGSARPAVAAAINLYSFYLVGAPAALIMAFVFQMGFVGLCLGLLAAQVACVVSVCFAAYNTDWELEARKAADLVGMVDGEDGRGLLKESDAGV